MTIIGVTGGIGSGKTTVTDIFASLSICVVDADIVAREAVAIGTATLTQISERYSADILLPSGELDRAKLRQIVFDNPRERLWLESVTHPEIRKRIIKQLEECLSPYCILSSPLLIESKQTELVDCTLLVDIPVELQLSRAAGRDGRSEAEIQKIIAAQIERETRLEIADDIIDNSHSLEATQQQVAILHQRYLKLAKNDR